MKKRLLCLLLFAFFVGTLLPVGFAEEEKVLLTLHDNEQIAYEPYRLYLQVVRGVSRYSTRQGITFTRAMESYMQANHVILANDEFLALCDEEMSAYLDSEPFSITAGILKTYYQLTDEEILRCVWENYWSQYVARMLSGFFNAQAKMSDTSSEIMFNEFRDQFYANFSFDSEGVALFSGEDIAWTPMYENLCLFNEINSLLETADSIAQNRCVEKYLEENHIPVHYDTLEQSIEEAVASMKSNELYERVLTDILQDEGCQLDDFLVAMKPFAMANYQRAAFGQECYESYNQLSEDQKEITPMEDYYFGQLEAITQTYTLEYLGW